MSLRCSLPLTSHTTLISAPCTPPLCVGQPISGKPCAELVRVPRLFVQRVRPAPGMCLRRPSTSEQFSSRWHTFTRSIDHNRTSFLLPQRSLLPRLSSSTRSLSGGNSRFRYLPLVVSQLPQMQPC